MSAHLFKSLHRHFVVATSKTRGPIVAAHLEKQTPYSQVAQEIFDAATLAGESLNPIFRNFCE